MSSEHGASIIILYNIIKATPSDLFHGLVENLFELCHIHSFSQSRYQNNGNKFPAYQAMDVPAELLMVSHKLQYSEP